MQPQSTDTLNKRMTLARQQGWSEDEIQRSATRELQRQQITNMMQPRSKQEPQAAGRAGGLKGIALDLLPFGRVAEKAINPNAGQITGGELLSEAALTALPFGIGRLAKGVKAGKAAISTARGVDETAARVAQPSLRQRAASQLTRTGSGFKVGGKVGDIGKLDEATKVFQKYGIAGKPDVQLRKVNQAMSAIGGKVDEALGKTTLNKNAIRLKLSEGATDPLKYADIDLTLPGVQKHLATHLKKFESTKTAKEVNDYIKTLNPVAIRAQDKLARGVNLTDKEAAAFAAKKAGDEAIGEIADVKPFKKDMAILYERNPEIAKLAEQKAKLPIPLVDVQSRQAKQLASGTKSKIGQLISGAGRTERATGGFRPFMTPAKFVAQQGVTRKGAELFGMRDEGIVPEDTDAGFTTPFVGQTGAEGVNETPWLPHGTSGPLDPETKEPQTGFQSIFSDPQKLEMAYMEALMQGDKETANLLLAGAKQFATEDKKTGKEQAKLQAGKTVVDNLMQVYDEAAGGAQGLYAGTTADVLGRLNIGEGNEKARAYEQNRRSYLTPIIKAFGEVGVLTDKDREVIADAIPSIKDSPAQAQQKRQLLYTMLESLGGGGGSDDLGSTLEQYIQQQVQSQGTY